MKIKHPCTKQTSVLRAAYRRVVTACSVVLCAFSATAQPLSLSGTNQMEVGNYVTLVPSTRGGSWSSSNPSVATVDRGVVQSVATGTATISYTSTTGSVTSLATTTVTVNPVTTICMPWESIGGSGGATGTRSGFTLDKTGVPYIAYAENGSKQLTVKKYSGSGSSWTTVGSTGFSTAGTDYIDIAVDFSGTPYVAFTDAANANKITVMKYNGTSWAIVGTAGFSATNTAYCKLAFDSTGVPYVAYLEYTPGTGSWFRETSSSQSLGVKKFNGSSWVNVGTIVASPDAMWETGNDHNSISFVIDNAGAPMLAYVTAASTINVLKYNGSSWINLGNPGAGLGEASYPDITISRNNVPYVSFIAGGSDPVAAKYVSSSWITLGSLTSSSSDYSSIAVDANENVYLAFQSWGEDLSGKVMKYNGSTWQSYGLTGYTGTQIMVNNDGVVYEKSYNHAVSRLTNRTTAVEPNEGPTAVCVGSLPSFSNPLGYSAWTSSNNSILLKYLGHIFRADAAGVVTVTYYNGSCQQTHTVTVNAAPTISPSTVTLCAGSTTTLTGSPTGGTWTSVGPSIATVGTAGNVSAIAGGSTTVAYSFGGCSTNRSVVVDVPANSLAGAATVDVTRSIDLLTSASGGTWSASNANVTVGTATAAPLIGVVRGVTAGTVIITYTASNTCGASQATKTVTVQPFSCTAWNYLGSPGISSFNAPFISMALDAGGTPYLAYSDGSSGPARVKKYSAGTWTAIGDAISTGRASDTRIAMAPDGTPYVVCQDVGDADLVKVKKYNGTSWELVGSALPATAKNAVIAIDNSGTPYIVFKDFANGNKATVKKFNGTDWAVVGTAGISAGIINKPTIAINASGTPYVAYTDSSTGGKATVMKYDGSTWTNVGTAGISAGVATSVSIAISPSGIPYVAYQDWANRLRATVQSFDGTAWSVVGSPGFISEYSAFSQTTAVVANIAFGTDGTPYIGFSMNGVKAAVMVYDGAGWKNQGIHGFTPNNSNVGSLCIDGSGNLFIAIGDASVSGFASVMKFGSGLPAITGSGGVCPGATITLANINPGGTWSSSNTTVATVGTNGVVTGAGTGITTISYAIGGSCVSTKDVTSGAYAGTIGGPSTVRQGGTAAQIPSVPGGVWSVSNANATASFTGVVTGVTMGTATLSYTVYTSCGSATITKDITITLPSILGPLAISGTGTTTTLSNAIAGGTWSAGCNEIATVSAAGEVTGVSNGVATITYTAVGEYVTAEVTVNTATSAITGTYSVCAGATTALTHPVSGGNWSSSDTLVATVAADGTVTGLMAGTATISYAYGSGCTSTVTITVNAAPAAITGTALVCVGATTTLSSTTSGGSWSSATPTVASINSSGIVTGVSVNSTTISYTLSSGCASTRVVTVNAGTTAGTISGASAVAVGSSISLSASASGGSWTSSNTAVASVTGSGTVTGVSAGVVTISYSVSSSCGTSVATKTITVGSTSVDDISGSMAVCSGQTTTLSSTTAGGSWSSGNTVVATVSAGGVVSGLSPGIATISYSVAGGYATAVITVNAQPATIAGPAAVCTGSSITLSSATADATWSSSNSNADVSATGVVTGLMAGTAAISYTNSNGCARTQLITINAQPAITATATLCPGTTTTLTTSVAGGDWDGGSGIATISPAGVVTGITAGTANVTYTAAGCSAITVVTVTAVPTVIYGSAKACPGTTTTLATASTGGAWSSGNTAIATVDASGIVTGVTTGTVNISYTFGSTGCARIAVVTVNPNPVITGPSSICEGATAAFTPSITAGGLSWSSSNGTVASVSSTGVVYGLAAGNATITYTLGSGCMGTAAVTVTSVPAISGPSVICAGATTMFTNTASGGTWSTSNTAIATADAGSGAVTGIAAGVIRITYTAGGCFTAKLITVNAQPGVITGNHVACIGFATTLSNATGTWSSSTPAVASVPTASLGRVVGVSAGTAVITFTAASTGCSRSSVVTVQAAPSASTGTTTVCAGQAAILSNSTPGGSWSSSHPAVASVDGTGTVTSVSQGTANITYSFGSTCRTVTPFTVRPLPAAISGTATVCMPSATTLGNTTNGGTWSSSNTAVATVGSVVSALNGRVVGVSAGTAEISYTLSATGCSRSTVVTVNAGANAGTITSGTGTYTLRVTTAPTLALTSSGDAGGTWSSNNPSRATVNPATGVVTAVSSGNVTITYSVTSGCTNFATRYITVLSGRDGNSITEASAAISLYPNPTTGSFTLQTEQPGTLNIFTMDGRELASHEVAAGATQLSMPSEAAAGIYMCRFTAADGTSTIVRLVYEN